MYFLECRTPPRIKNRHYQDDNIYLLWCSKGWQAEANLTILTCKGFFRIRKWISPKITISKDLPFGMRTYFLVSIRPSAAYMIWPHGSQVAEKHGNDGLQPFSGGSHPWKLTRHWKIPIFKREYIFLQGGFSCQSCQCSGGVVPLLNGL